MMPDKCPNCGARQIAVTPARATYDCGSSHFMSGDTLYKIYTCDLDTLWQLRLTLTEIAWMARCEYERTKKFNEGYDAGFSQARLGALIGTGGDTK